MGYILVEYVGQMFGKTYGDINVKYIYKQKLLINFDDEQKLYLINGNTKLYL